MICSGGDVIEKIEIEIGNDIEIEIKIEIYIEKVIDKIEIEI